MADPTAVEAQAAIPRSEVSVGVEPGLRRELASIANGRPLVIDYFASRRCSVVIGDLTSDFAQTAPSPGSGYVELARIEGVRVFAEGRLLPILRTGEATLRLAGPPFARHLSVRLEQPERWLEFLDRPGVLAGKGPFRTPRR